MKELAASLARDGVLQPVIVRSAGNDEYELVAGERRWRAAQMAGMLKVPALVKEVADDRLLELALIENLQREELNPIEAANAYQTLIDELGLTQEAVGERVGKNRVTIANTVRVLNLPPEVQTLIRRGELSAGHSKALVGLANTKAQIDLARRIVKDGLSVRQVEALVSRRGPAGPRRGRPDNRDPNVVAAEERLQRTLGTKVRIVPARKGGRVELHYFGDEELERLYGLLVSAGRPA